MEVQLKEARNNSFMVILFTTIMFAVNAQSICFELDSIKMTGIPLSTKTVLAYSDYEVRNFPIEYRTEIMYVEKQILDEFVELDLFSNDRRKRSMKSLDARIVIDLYLFGGEVVTISLDVDFNYEFSGSSYGRYYKLNDWLTEYVVKLVEKRED